MKQKKGHKQQDVGMDASTLLSLSYSQIYLMVTVPRSSKYSLIRLNMAAPRRSFAIDKSPTFHSLYIIDHPYDMIF